MCHFLFQFPGLRGGALEVFLKMSGSQWFVHVFAARAAGPCRDELRLLQGASPHRNRCTLSRPLKILHPATRSSTKICCEIFSSSATCNLRCVDIWIKSQSAWCPSKRKEEELSGLLQVSNRPLQQHHALVVCIRQCP